MRRSYEIQGSITGRIPNLQNIPIRHETDRRVLPVRGYIEVDFSHLEQYMVQMLERHMAREPMRHHGRPR